MSYNPVPKLTNGNATFDNDLNVSGISTFDAGIKTPLNTAADGATVTFDMDVSNNHSVTLGGNRALAVSNVDAGQKFTLRLKQDGTGSRVVTWWSGITWFTSAGAAPTLKTDPNTVDYIGFICTSGGYYEGFHLTENSSGGGGGSSSITVRESDGTPNVSNVSTIVVSNGTLTDDGSGQVTISTGGGGGGGSYDDTYVSGVSTFASGLAIQNQTDIATVSGLLYDDAAISGYFESRVDTNAADIITVSGLTGGGSSLTVQDVDGSPSVSNVTTIRVTNGSLTDNGGGTVTIATSGGGGGGGGTTYTAGSGLSLVGTEFNVYGGSGNFRYAELTASDEVPTFKYLGSGVTDTPINLEVHSSLQSATGSGTALLFQGTQGQLFSITDNLSSGTIFNVSDITGLPMLEITASGDVEIGEFADTITVHQPILLSGGVPANTTNKLYNDAGTLKFNGSAIGGGGGGLPYSSGDYYLNSINTVSGLIPPNTFNITAGDGTNYTIDGMGLNSASDPTMYIHKGHTYVFNKTFSGHPFAVSATDGGSVYSDADGNAIEIGSSAGSVTFEVPQDAPDKLYYYCTAHPSTMKGVIYTTTDGATSGYFEARVDQNAADIITVSGLTGGGGGGGSYTAGSGLTLVGTEFNVYGGSGNFENIDLTTDAAVVPKMVFTGSGVTDTPIRMKVLSSHASASTSGTALAFEGTEGQLFGITDNLSSGRIFSVNDITGLPLISVDASGDVELAEFGRDIIAHKAITLQSGVPSVTTNKLYNDGYGLYFNGSAVGGGSSYTAGSGLTLVGTEFNVHGGSGHFINLDVEGAFTATTKSFLIDHPSKEGMRLQYASLEGPENGVYVRGTTDEGFITLPDYWRDLVHNGSITVTLTPVGQFQPLFVEQKSNREIRVGGVCGYYDYVVYGERKDVDKLEVEW